MMSGEAMTEEFSEELPVEELSSDDAFDDAVSDVAPDADDFDDADAGDPSIESLVQMVVVALVDEPEAVQVSSHEEGSSLVIDVKVAPDDAGKVIGRQGRIIKALRTLARAASSYQGGKHIEVEILD
jgi:predicted RNA-binding protein YlqC (UPF0109 family)